MRSAWNIEAVTACVAALLGAGGARALVERLAPGDGVERGAGLTSTGLMALYRAAVELTGDAGLACRAGTALGDKMESSLGGGTSGPGLIEAVEMPVAQVNAVVPVRVAPVAVAGLSAVLRCGPEPGLEHEPTACDVARGFLVAASAVAGMGPAVLVGEPCTGKGADCVFALGFEEDPGTAAGWDRDHGGPGPDPVPLTTLGPEDAAAGQERAGASRRAAEVVLLCHER
ncbi:MAG: hypothetical protein ACYDH5_16260 [Acidimicrobiales bacterium]